MQYLGSKEREMVDYEVHWFALGGGPSGQIYERFGMTDRDFFSRVNDLVELEVTRDLSDQTAKRMRQVIRRRLWLAT